MDMVIIIIQDIMALQGHEIKFICDVNASHE